LRSGGNFRERGENSLRHPISITVAYPFLRVEKKEEKRQNKGAEALRVVE